MPAAANALVNFDRGCRRSNIAEFLDITCIKNIHRPLCGAAAYAMSAGAACHLTVYRHTHCPHGKSSGPTFCEISQLWIIIVYGR